MDVFNENQPFTRADLISGTQHRRGRTLGPAETSFRATLTFTDAVQRPELTVRNLRNLIPKPDTGLGAETGHAHPRRDGSWRDYLTGKTH